jgi:hypothetical protein
LPGVDDGVALRQQPNRVVPQVVRLDQHGACIDVDADLIAGDGVLLDACQGLKALLVTVSTICTPATGARITLGVIVADVSAVLTSSNG